MPCNWNESTGYVETLLERYQRETASRLEQSCDTCRGTGSKDGTHLDCPDCDAAEIIAEHERRKVAAIS